MICSSIIYPIVIFLLICPSRDVKMKSMERTVKHAEKYLGEICCLLSSYTRKTAKLRDNADLLVVQIFDFSNTQDPELETGLKKLAEDLACINELCSLLST